MHPSSYRNMRKFVEDYLVGQHNIRILDLGSQVVEEGAYSSYRPLFNQHGWSYSGCDMVEGNNVEIVLENVYDWKEVPSDTYDVIISGQTFEHIEFIWGSIMEVARSLKEGGICCIIAPSSGTCHRYPFDCWRIYEDGFHALARFAGLEVLDVYTERTRFEAPEYDPEWKDSVLIAKKPFYHLEEREKWVRKYKLCKELLHDIPQRETDPPIYVPAQLFFDFSGEGYSEENSIRQGIEVQNGRFSIYWDMAAFRAKKNMQIIRFDPAKHPINIHVQGATCEYLNGTSVALSMLNINYSPTK